MDLETKVVGNSLFQKCPWCTKWVKHKLFVGTLHICLTEEEKRHLLAQRQQQRLP